MKYLKKSSQYIKINSHLYIRCKSCNGIFLLERIYKSTQPTIVKCNHCGSNFIPQISRPPQNISRFILAVVQKEEPMQKVLRFIREDENGINRKRLVKLLTKLRYREKVAGQLMSLGLIRQMNDIYFITERGRKVLKACNF